LLQFAAHEFAYLSFDENGKLEGDKKYLIRIATLFRFSIKWSSMMGVLVFPAIFMIGYYILNKNDVGVDWVLPWIIYSFASVFVFINNVVLSFLEGCNSVGDIQKIRLKISIANVIMLLTGLLLGWELYALAVGMLVILVAGTLFVFMNYADNLVYILAISKGKEHTWAKEIFPLLWRYAISWSSAFFIFQIFTPLSFSYYGAIEAGKVGMSLAVVMAIFGISNVWITSILPRINMLVAKKDYKSLDALFKKRLLYAFSTYIILSLVLFGALHLYSGELALLERIVSSDSLLFVSVGWLFQIGFSGYAVYMRAHKKEPVVMLSFCMGVYIAFTTWILAFSLPFEYFFLGFLSSYIFVVPWLYVIYKKFKKEVAGVS